MTHLPDITPEQALAVLLKGAKLQQGPKSRTPLLEAVIGIGKDHHAYIGLQQEDIDALAKVLEGGTWSAGRRIAAEKREGGGPPLTIVSDGTVF